MTNTTYRKHPMKRRTAYVRGGGSYETTYNGVFFTVYSYREAINYYRPYGQKGTFWSFNLGPNGGVHDGFASKRDALDYALKTIDKTCARKVGELVRSIGPVRCDRA